MASFRFNVARIKGCPSPEEVAQAMEEFGLPETEEYGVLNYSVTDDTLFGTIIRKTQQAIQKLDAETREITAAPVEKVTVFPFAVKPAMEHLEIYAGGNTAIEQVGMFFSSCLAFATVTEAIEVDVVSALEKLQENTQRFQLVSIRVSDYAHNSYMIGPYIPKFIDSQHGLDFLNQYLEALQSATVRFAGPSGRVNVKITPNACFSFSCSEDDEPVVKSHLRKLVGINSPAPKESQASLIDSEDVQ